MDSAKIMAKLRIMQTRALTAAAYVLLAHVLPFVPIHTGALRQSGKVKDFDGGVAIAFGGGSPSDKYAAYQYFDAKYHNFANGAMARMLELLRGEERASATGDIETDRYAAAYQQAKDEGRLTLFPNGARWFEIIMKDPEVQHRAWVAYSNALRVA